MTSEPQYLAFYTLPDRGRNWAADHGTGDPWQTARTTIREIRFSKVPRKYSGSPNGTFVALLLYTLIRGAYWSGNSSYSWGYRVNLAVQSTLYLWTDFRYSVLYLYLVHSMLRVRSQELWPLGICREQTSAKVNIQQTPTNPQSIEGSRPNDLRVLLQ